MAVPVQANRGRQKLKGGEYVQIRSRNDKDLTRMYPRLPLAAQKLTVIEPELVEPVMALRQFRHGLRCHRDDKGW
jgi:hypothetical protein